MAILKLEVSKPYELALKYNKGVNVTSRFGPQVQFVLTSGDILYLPPKAADEIASLNLSPQEPFLLTKLSKGQWSVERKPVAAGPQLVPPPAQPNLPIAPDELGVSEKDIPTKADGVNKYYLDRATKLIDVFAAAHQYSVQHYNGTLSKEDIRALVISVFIQCTPKAQGTGSY